MTKLENRIIIVEKVVMSKISVVLGQKGHTITNSNHNLSQKNLFPVYISLPLKKT